MFDKKIANMAFFLALCSPIVEAIFFLATPDSPFLMFWALSLYVTYKGIFENKKRCIYFSGLVIGCGMLSKYIMILFVPSLLLFLLFSKNYRYHLKQIHIYIMLLIAFMATLPVVYWNYTHDWVSFLFQIHHGISETSFNLGAFTDYLGGQLLICGIPVFLSLLYFIIRYGKFIITQDKLAFLFWPCLFSFGFFGYRALFQHMEANWAAGSYISGFILVAYFVINNKIKWISSVSFGFIMIIITLAKLPLLFTPQALHNRNEIKMVNSFYGSKELIKNITKFTDKDDIILACDYGNASKIWFYLNSHQIYVLEKFKYAHMYQYWNQNLPMPIKSAVYVCDNNVDVNSNEAIHSYFKTVTLKQIATYDNIVGSKGLYIYKVTN